MKELILNPIDLYSIKLRFENKCYKMAKYWSSLGESEEIKKYKFGYKFDGSNINIYPPKGLIYLSIKISNIEGDKKKLLIQTFVSYYSIFFYLLFSIPLFIKIFFNQLIPSLVYLLPLSSLTVIMVYSYIFKSKKIEKFVRSLFDDLIIESS